MNLMNDNDVKKFFLPTEQNANMLLSLALWLSLIRVNFYQLPL